MTGWPSAMECSMRVLVGVSVASPISKPPTRDQESDKLSKVVHTSMKILYFMDK